MESIGPYRLDAELGRGAMGVVFRGFDPAIGRAVAIKIIRLDQFATANEKAELKLRFAREAAAAGKLSHPNIVAVFHLGEQGDTQYLVLELVEGWSLEKTLADGQPRDRKVSISMLSQVAGALDYAHGEGIVHRDVKPANILVRPDGKVKITDFGIARISSQTITRTGFSMGTPAYMAPEQIVSSRVNGRADQFSLAVIAYQLLAGRRPFIADTDPALIHKIVYEEAQALHEIDGSFPPRTSDVLRRGMAKDPSRRYATCAEFIKALADSLGGVMAAASMVVPKPAPKAGIAPQARANRARTQAPGWAIALGAAALVTLILIVGVGGFERPAQRRAVVNSVAHVGDSKVNPREGLKYVWIPPGRFMMGCSPRDAECLEPEKPKHEVTIARGFWLEQKDVTQAAYQQVIGSNPSYFKGDSLPVEQVNWDEAQSYCHAAGGRLPTEAEWEYAARGEPGSTPARYGNLVDIAWYSGNSGGKTHEVAQKQPNAFGLYDMLGNVWQWVADWYGEKYYQAAERQDPAGPLSGTLRALRGGSWNNAPRAARASFRGGIEPGYRNYNLGLRCVGE